MIIIEVAGAQATIQRGTWSSDDPRLLQLIEALRPERATFSVDPDPDQSQARYVVLTIGGRIVEADAGQPPAAEPGRIY